MTVKIEAEGMDYVDALRKLGGVKPLPMIAIDRRAAADNWGDRPQRGYIVRVAGMVDKEFQSVGDTITHLTELLKKHDHEVVERLSRSTTG